MIDPFGRAIHYLRVSVTDRCDLRCVYCMSEDMTFLPKNELLSLEELDRMCSAFVDLGVKKLRITGGEPLVRKNVMGLFQGLGRHLKTGALDELTLTTNGTQLAKFAEPLRSAGVQRINVSLDSLDPARFKTITRWGDHAQVMDGIRAAKAAGLKTTCHAGEFGMHWHNVRTAVQVLGCDRIDHGYTVVDEPQASAALLSECAEKGVVFTVVPTNSYYLRTLTNDRWAKDHPIRRMPGLGIRIHPNTDDPTLHHVTPSGAWQMMANDFGFGLPDLRQFTENGLDAAWIDDSTCRAWKAEHLAEFDALAAQIE